LKISLSNVSTVLIFFTAGLLFLCLEHVFHRERIASRWRPAFSLENNTGLARSGNSVLWSENNSVTQTF
jgi:hypothetical protein